MSSYAVRSLFVVVPVLLAFGSASCAGHDAVAGRSEALQSFDKFAVLWLGDSYDPGNGGERLELREAKYIVNPPGAFHPEIRSFSLLYGTCKIRPGRSSCTLPLQITLYDPCETPILSDLAKDHTIRIRGVDAIVTTGGSIWIETEEFTVSVSTAFPIEPGKPLPNDLDNSMKVAEALFGANDKAKHITKGADFEVKSGACAAASAPTPAPVVSGPQLDLMVTDNGTSLTVTLNASGNTSSPYVGAQIRFNVPSVLLQFGGGSVGGPLAAAACENYVTRDHPAPGRTEVIFVCSLLEIGTVSGAGALVSVTLSEAGNGCADIVMDTGPSGTAVNGVDGAQPSTYGVTTVQVATVGTGGVCPP